MKKTQTFTVHLKSMRQFLERRCPWTTFLEWRNASPLMMSDERLNLKSLVRLYFSSLRMSLRGPLEQYSLTTYLQCNVILIIEVVLLVLEDVTQRSLGAVLAHHVSTM